MKNTEEKLTERNRLLQDAQSHLAFMTRDAEKWWDDEHCLDNIASASIVRRLIKELRDE